MNCKNCENYKLIKETLKISNNTIKTLELLLNPSKKKQIA